MNRREFNGAIASAAAASLFSHGAIAAGTPWIFHADVAESCSCEIPCPCNFGRRTDLKCEGSRLIQIREGHLGDHDLAGINFIATFDMGNWVRLYVDEGMNAAQREGFEKILPIAFGGFKKLSKSTEFVPLAVTRGDDKVRFEVPASTVEILMMRGLNDEPIRINGLPSPVFHNYVQYKSLVHKHTSEGGSFSHEDTNGFTSRMIVSGTV